LDNLKNRDHSAICLNKRTSIHRLSVVEYLLSIDNGRNFISCPSGYWNWVEGKGEIEGRVELREIEKELRLNDSRWVYNGIGNSEFYDRLPLIVDVKNHVIGSNPSPAVQTARVIFDYVTETQFDSQITFVTEKSYKPFAELTIPLFIGTPGTVRHLKERGYKLNALDYSYDSILDDEDRFCAIMKLIKQTQEMSQEESIELYRKNIDDIVYNYDLLLERSK